MNTDSDRQRAATQVSRGYNSSCMADSSGANPDADPVQNGAYGHAHSQAPQTPNPYPPQYPSPYSHEPSAKWPKSVEVAPGRPYHQMARTAALRWWRPLVGTGAILIVTWFAALLSLGVETVVYRISAGEWPDHDHDAAGQDPIFGNALLDGVFQVGMPALVLLVWIWAIFGTAKDVQKRPPGTLSSVAGRVRWRWLAVCCGLAAAFCAVLVGSALLADLTLEAPPMPNNLATGDGSWVGWDWVVGPALLVIVVTAQEYTFRAWVLQAVGAFTLETRHGRVGRALSVVFRTPWPAIVVSAALFTYLFNYADLGKLNVFVFAVAAGWVAVRTGGLEAPIAMAVVSLIGAAAFGLTAEEGDDFSWQIAVHIGAVLLFAAAAVWLARRRHIQTVSAASPPSAASNYATTG